MPWRLNSFDDSGPFVDIPDYLLAAKISDSAFRLLSALLSLREGGADSIIATDDVIRERSTLNEAKSRRAMAELVDAGLITVGPNPHLVTFRLDARDRTEG